LRAWEGAEGYYAVYEGLEEGGAEEGAVAAGGVALVRGLDEWDWMGERESVESAEREEVASGYVPEEMVCRWVLKRG
jgi:hypothetical protein